MEATTRWPCCVIPSLARCHASALRWTHPPASRQQLHVCNGYSYNPFAPLCYCCSGAMDAFTRITATPSGSSTIGAASSTAVHVPLLPPLPSNCCLYRTPGRREATTHRCTPLPAAADGVPHPAGEPASSSTCNCAVGKGGSIRTRCYRVIRQPPLRFHISDDLARNGRPCLQPPAPTARGHTAPSPL